MRNFDVKENRDQNPFNHHTTPEYSKPKAYSSALATACLLSPLRNCTETHTVTSGTLIMANTSSISIHDRIPLEGSESRIPRLGYGVWKSPKDICTQSVLTALSLGYRHIDTAQLYQNEAEVGAAIKASGIPRKEIFVTTKMQYPANDSVEDTLERMKRSVQLIDPGEENRNGYVDLFLVHTPASGPVGREILWKALELLKEEGKTIDIGVSN